MPLPLSLSPEPTVFVARTAAGSIWERHWAIVDNCARVKWWPRPIQVIVLGAPALSLCADPTPMFSRQRPGTVHNVTAAKYEFGPWTLNQLFCFIGDFPPSQYSKVLVSQRVFCFLVDFFPPDQAQAAGAFHGRALDPEGGASSENVLLPSFFLLFAFCFFASTELGAFFWCFWFGFLPSRLGKCMLSLEAPLKNRQTTEGVGISSVSIFTKAAHVHP